MVPSKSNADANSDEHDKALGSASAGGEKRPKKRKSISMHEGIAVWADCCSCEAEPRWAALAEEMGVDLSDYEADEEE